MKLWVYKLKLAINLVFFFLKLSANFSKKTKPIILGLFVFVLFFCIIGISILSKQKPEENLQSSPIEPKNLNLYLVKEFSNKELIEEISYWNKVLEVQPQSRDVLLNLANLYSAAGENEVASQFRIKAEIIDPNNPLFE